MPQNLPLPSFYSIIVRSLILFIRAPYNIFKLRKDDQRQWQIIAEGIREKIVDNRLFRYPHMVLVKIEGEIAEKMFVSGRMIIA